MTSTRSVVLLVGLLVGGTLSGACSDDGVTPDDTGSTEAVSRDDVVGAFSATTFMTTTDGATTDQLSEGATLDVTLHENGTTTGDLFVPGGGEDGGDFEADLSGTFAFDDSNDTMTFDHDTDAFVRDMTFSASRSDGVVRLEGEETFSGTTVRLVLE